MSHELGGIDPRATYSLRQRTTSGHRDAGIPGVQVQQDVDDMPFRAEDWITVVMGSGLRRIGIDLGPQRAEILSDTERWAGERQLGTVRVSSNYATRSNHHETQPGLGLFRASRPHYWARLTTERFATRR